MDGLSPLFPHQSCPNMEPSQPRDDMVLHDMHFRQDGGPGELLPVETHKDSDVLLCEWKCKSVRVHYSFDILAKLVDVFGRIVAPMALPE